MKFGRIFDEFSMIFETVFLTFSFGKGMRSRKVDSVKIVLSPAREHDFRYIALVKSRQQCVRIRMLFEVDSLSYSVPIWA